MRNKRAKQIITFALVLSMAMPITAAYADSKADESKADVTANSAADDSKTDSTADSKADDKTESKADEADSKADTKADEKADGKADEKTDDKSDGKSGTSTKKEEEKKVMITDDEALKSCEKVAENKNLILYLDKQSKRLCMRVKSSGKCWWTSPINAEADPTPVDAKGNTMKGGLVNKVSSSLAVKVAQLAKNNVPENQYSGSVMTTFTKESNGCAATYNYSMYGIKITAHFELCDNSLKVYVDSKDIEEQYTSNEDGKVVTSLTLCPFMGAVSSVNVDGSPTSGYMIVPDGSGAVINYNNGKTGYETYTQRVYGRDYTAVPLKAPKVREQAFMPVLATVSGKSGLVMVATEGDANVDVNAEVSGQNNSAYNSCNFSFETRSSDEFYMSGSEGNIIKMYEKNGIKTERFAVEYFPVESEKEDVNYADCAKVYRDYLIDRKGLKQTAQEFSNDFYMDTYGSALKEKSILGIPVTVKQKLTTFDNAKKMTDELHGAGVDTIVVNYNNWTKNSVKNKVSTKAKPLGKLGSKKDMQSLNGDSTKVYGSVNNFTMKKSSFGYMTLTNTAIRVSSAYSRQTSYNPAFSVAEPGVAPALIAPNTYKKIFKQTLDSFKDQGYDAMGYGDWSTKLVSDFSKKNQSSRNDTMHTIVDGYKAASDGGQSIIAEGANSYVLPYVSAVTDVPVYSSGFTMTDEDIPFYQMVIHGYIPYATKPINASSQTDLTFMRSIAAGSNLNYDMIYASADNLLDTDYDDLFYSNYDAWKETAENQYKVSSTVLSGVGDYTISKYESDGDVIKTTYSKKGKADIVIEVDLKNRTVKALDKTFDLEAEGAVEKGGASN